MPDTKELVQTVHLGQKLAFVPNTKDVQLFFRVTQLFQGPNPVDRRHVEEGLAQIFDFLKSHRVKRWTA